MNISGKFISSLLAGILLSGNGIVSAQNTSYFKKQITELASSKYGGRGYYGDNDGKAACYIAREFAKSKALPISKALGINTAGQNIDGYFQTFTFPINDFNGIVELSIDGQPLTPGNDFIPQSFSGGGQGTFDLYYVDTAGFNVKETMKYLQENGEGKIVAGEMMQMMQLFIGNFKAFSNLKIGGVLTWTDTEERAAAVKLQGMGMHMDGLSPLMFSKNYMEPLMLPFPFITVAFDSLKKAKTVSLHIENQINLKEETKNVIACIKGNDPTSDSIIVISAHYDHLGMLGAETFYPGANDNASGVSMLLSLAKYFGKPENRPAVTLVFIATTGEEMGLLGSRYFVDHSPVSLKAIKYVVNIDMVADQTHEIYTAADNRGMRGYNLFNRINEREELGFTLRLSRPQQNSDHYPFSRKKVPAIDFTMDNGPTFKNLHTPGDTPKNAYYDNFPNLLKLYTSFIREY